MLDFTSKYMLNIWHWKLFFVWISLHNLWIVFLQNNWTNNGPLGLYHRYFFEWFSLLEFSQWIKLISSYISSVGERLSEWTNEQVSERVSEKCQSIIEKSFVYKCAIHNVCSMAEDLLIWLADETWQAEIWHKIYLQLLPFYMIICPSVDGIINHVQHLGKVSINHLVDFFFFKSEFDLGVW